MCLKTLHCSHQCPQKAITAEKQKNITNNDSRYCVDAVLKTVLLQTCSNRSDVCKQKNERVQMLPRQGEVDEFALFTFKVGKKILRPKKSRQ